MKAIVTALCLLLFCNCIVYAQTYNWVKGGGTTATTTRYGGDPDEASYYMCTDLNGNIYSLNYVGNGTVTSDSFYSSGIGAGGNTNILITSYNCSGQMRWAKLIGSGLMCTGFGIEIDSFSHIYIAGTFNHQYSYPLYIGSDTTISGLEYESTGVIELDTNGHFNWIRFIGQNTWAGEIATETGYGTTALDKQQNFHFIKFFGPGSEITSTITSIFGNYDLTYNSSGTLINVQQLHFDTTLVISGAVVDTSTNKLFVYGSREAEFTDSLSNYPFVAAFDIARNLIWSDTLGFASTTAVFVGIGTDGIGHLYIAASGQGILAYLGDTIVGEAVSFIMKTDTAGNPQWMRPFIGTLNDGFSSFTLMPGNKMAAAGLILGEIAAGGDTIISYAGEVYNPFFTILDTGGTVQALQQIHGSGTYDGAWSIASDKVGNLYIGGEVADSVWADTITGYRSVGGTSDFFIMKYGVSCSCTSMPIASYTSASSGTAGVDVSFTYTGPTADIDSIRWNFGDGATTATTSPTHTYTAAGTFNACVYIYSYCGNYIYCTNVNIPCVTAPTASLTSSGGNATRNFHYSGTGTGLDSIVWHYSDGGHDTGITAAHIFTSTGTYTVCVYAYNPCGSDSSCSTVTISCVTAPTASLTTSGTTATRNFTYTGTTTGVDSVAWLFGDGHRASGTTASHTYTDTGTFTACVIAYSPCGSDTSCASITIPCTHAPTASYTHTGTTTINYTYTGTTTAVDSIVWNFGDGTSATGTTATHTYTATGTFAACVIAYNPCGSDSACSTITISCLAAPIASFTDTGSYPANFNYTGTTTGLDSVVWNFGDGVSGRGLTISHTYAVPDTYMVCIVAYNPCGIDTACNTIIIPCDTATASFTHSGTVNVNFAYTGTSTGIDSVAWTYGDGSRGAGNTSTHSYAVSGTYHVCVIAYTNCAVDSVCSDITVTGTFVYSPPLNSVKVFPNPATDELTITGITQSTTYQLLNITSVCLQQGILQQGSNIVLMKNIVPGIYILELTATDGSKNILKIIKE